MFSGPQRHQRPRRDDDGRERVTRESASAMAAAAEHAAAMAAAASPTMPDVPNGPEPWMLRAVFELRHRRVATAVGAAGDATELPPVLASLTPPRVGVGWNWGRRRKRSSA